MRFGSVCSGIEAASLAFAPLGWKAAWVSEIDSFPSAVLAHHYPDVPNLGDMRTLPRRILDGDIEAPDLVCGGTPCQAFSVAGLRQSLDDTRGNLSLIFCEIADATDTVRRGRGDPEVIILWENVPGVLSTRDNAFGCVLAGLCGDDQPLEPSPRPAAGKSGRFWRWNKAAGKHAPCWPDAGAVAGPTRTVAWRILDAQYFGLAQRRRRLFVVASARAGFDPAEVLLEFEGLRRDSAPSRGTGKDAPTIPSRRTAGGGLGTDFDCDGGLIAGTLTASEGPNGHGHGDFLSNQAVDAGYIVAAFGGNNTTGEIDVATALRAKGGTGHGDFESETFIAFNTTQITHPENRSNPQPGDPVHPLSATDHPPAICRVDPPEEPPAMCFKPSHFTRGKDGAPSEVMPPLTKETDKGDQDALVLCFTGDGVVADPIGASEARTYTNEGKTFRLHNCVDQSAEDTRRKGLQVRRLTPLECSRLQGFPETYLDITYRGKPAMDGPKYKALGNSWAVANVAWIGRRIAAALRKT